MLAGGTFRSLGWSGDQCPICKSVQPFHFLGEPRKKEVWRQCGTCGVPIQVTEELRGKLYNNRRDAERSVQTLASMDNQVRLRPPEENRLGAIRDAFQLLAPLMRMRRRPRWDERTRRSAWITLVGSALVLLLASQLAATTASNLVVALVILLPLAGVIVTVYFFLNAPRRFASTHIAGWLGRALRSLKPTSPEIDQVLQEGKASGEPIYRLVTVKMLARKLKR
ncbi:MAG: hypothetical protein AMXMBFR33_32740 [Candidatus Xenobia bacterium]